MKAILRHLNKPWVIVLLLLVLATVLRVYNLNQLYVFGADEEYQANIAMTLVKDFHPIWIGVSASNTGFYLGPFWSYFTSFWLFLSQGDPLITAYVAALLGVFTTLAVFYIGWKIFSMRVGLIASILYACLPLIVFFDQKYWNPSTIPLLSVTMLYSLYKVKENQKYWLLFALAYGLVFHTHLSLAPFIILALLLVRKGIKKSVLIQATALFFLVISPLIIFDYFHKWSNITTPLRLGQIASSRNINLLEKGKALGETVMRLWYLPPHTINANEILTACAKFRSQPSILAVPFLAIVLIFFCRKQTWKNENSKILSMAIVIIVFSYLLFPGGIDEYYLLGLFPLLLFIPGIVWHKNLSPILLLLTVTLGIVSVLTTPNPYGLETKKQKISEVMAIVDDKPYDLTEKGNCHRFEGWRYLFSVYGRAPERSDIDSTFGWLYPDEITEVSTKYSVVMEGKDSENIGFTYQINESRQKLLDN